MMLLKSGGGAGPAPLFAAFNPIRRSGQLGKFNCPTNRNSLRLFFDLAVTAGDRVLYELADVLFQPPPRVTTLIHHMPAFIAGRLDVIFQLRLKLTDQISVPGATV